MVLLFYDILFLVISLELLHYLSAVVLDYLFLLYMFWLVLFLLYYNNLALFFVGVNV